MAVFVVITLYLGMQGYFNIKTIFLILNYINININYFYMYIDILLKRIIYLKFHVIKCVDLS